MAGSGSPLVVFGDFNCPFSALASRRGGALEEAGRVTVDWRAVEHDGAIPAAGKKLRGLDADDLDAELEQVRSLLLPGESLPLRRPPLRANTAAATAGYAAAAPAQRPALRAELFRRYWERGENLGDPAVLAAAGVQDGDASTAAAWRDEWRAAGPPVVPLLVLPGGELRRGLDALAHLAGLCR